MSTALAPAPPSPDLTRVDPRAVALLSERWARRHRVLPLALEDGVLSVATANEGDLDAERAIAFATGFRVRWVAVDPATLTEQMERWYPDGSRVDRATPPVEVQHIRFGLEARAESAEQGTSIVALVDELLADGINAGASDIHLEPEERGIAVRHRVDGVLRQVRTLPRALAPPLTSRMKILSGLDIADRLRPQDGRARVALRSTVVDLRISTLPASHGEKIVVRILDGAAGLRTLGAVGLEADDLARIRLLLQQREGLILVTGPTGSGKTTTLYAALREVDGRGVNVVTVEDPIEYRLPGIVQVQVHERAGLTFAAALRSIMRQDPDVILVGEIRDRETADIAVQASLTGHLVLSTLHTNDAASAVARLADIGVPGHRIATALKGVIAQRLVRRVCEGCAGRGCTVCGGGRFRGRVAIAEVLITSAAFERGVAAGVPTEQLAELARASGCRSLWQAGSALVARGITTIEELRRVAAEPPRQVADPPPVLRHRARLHVVGVEREADRGWLDALRAAVEPLASDVVLSAAPDAPAALAHRPDAVVIPLAQLPASSPSTDPSEETGPLILALAPEGAASESLAVLGRPATLVLPASSSPRLLLATLLALLRWRTA